MAGGLDSGAVVLPLVAVIVLLVVTVGLFLYLRQRLRTRRNDLLGELRSTPALVRDRAYNRLAMARREAEILTRRGIDVSGPAEEIARAQAAFDLRQYARALELAQSAHEGLVRRGRGEGRSPARGAPPPNAAAPRPGIEADPVPSDGPSTAPTDARPAAPLPKGRAEAQFLIGALERQLATAPATPQAAAARTYLADARTRFGAGEFPAAFQLAAKGRRALGEPGDIVPPTPASAPRGGAARPADAEGAAASLADAARCPACGYPTPAGDTFCRGCGRPLSPATCPACGAPRLAAERFCGRCGATFPA